jgi:small GTP-binding protein
MIQKKLCMVGSFGVGKTSLVKQYVQSIFSDKYHTTVGVKIDKKDVIVGSETIRMMIWDLAGDDDFTHLRTTFVRGSAGYLLVADGTRAKTLDVALELNRQIQNAVGALPFVLVVNKFDLVSTWEIETKHIAALEQDGIKVFLSSAKDGHGVQCIFEHFAALDTLKRAS